MKATRTIETALKLIILLAIVAFAPIAGAAITKANNTNNLDLTTSWVGGIVPGSSDIALWDNSVTLGSTALGSNLSFLGIQITKTGGGTGTITGNTLTLGASGIDASTATSSMNFTSNIILGAAQAWSYNATQAASFSGTINNGGNLLTINNGTQTITGIISGSGGLTRTGAGTTNIQNTMTYNGTTSINGGTLYVGNNGGAGALSSSTLITGTSGGILLFARNTDQTISNTITGDILVRKYITNTVTLTGANSYTGITSFDVGAFSVSSLNSVSGGTATSNMGAPTTVANGTIHFGNTVNDAKLIYTGTGETTDRVINLIGTTGNATIDQSGTGLLKFTSATTATGAGSKSLILQGSTAGTGEIAGAIVNNSGTNTTGVTKSGTGSWKLSGANTYSGATTINDGLLSVSSLNRVSGGSASSNLGAPTTTANGTISFGNAVNSAQLTYTGTGETTDRVINLAGTTGNATIDQSGTGILKFTSATTATGAGSKSLILQGSTAGQGIIAGAIVDNSGTNKTSVTKNGSGAWYLSGNNTYTGATTINNGILYLGDNTVTGTLSSASLITGTSSGILLFSSAANQTIANTIAGDILVRKYGANTVTLTGANSYTGQTSFDVGTFSVSSLNSVSGGTATSNMGAPITVAKGTIHFGNTVNSAQLTYTGTGETTDRVINLIGTTGNATIDQSGTGLLKFTSATTATGAGSKSLILQGSTAGTGEIAGAIVDNSGTNKTSVTKVGTGTWALSAANTYTGNTTVTAGTLLVSGGNINSSAVSVAAGATLTYNSSTARTGTIALNGSGLLSRATLSGNGTINTAVTLDNPGDTLSPGNSPGSQNFATTQTWASFTYLWETNNFTGTTAGTDFDQITITGGLTLSGGLGAYQIDVTSLTAGNVGGNVPNFSELNRSWTILTTTTGITGFNAADWTINLAGFSSTPAATGTWSLTQSSNDLVLSYAVPEPAGWMMLAGAGTFFMVMRRRRRE